MSLTNDAQAFIGMVVPETLYLTLYQSSMGLGRQLNAQRLHNGNCRL
jgi:hypothetical protein